MDASAYSNPRGKIWLLNLRAQSAKMSCDQLPLLLVELIQRLDPSLCGILREKNDQDTVFREESMASLQAQLNGVEKRLDAAYEDRFNPEIPSDVFERHFAKWQVERERLKRCISDFRTANPRSCIPEGIKLLELAQNAQKLFEMQVPREKRRLLELVVSNSTWKGGQLTVKYRQPFDLFATCSSAVQSESHAKKEGNAEMKNWLLR